MRWRASCDCDGLPAVAAACVAVRAAAAPAVNAAAPASGASAVQPNSFLRDTSDMSENPPWRFSRHQDLIALLHDVPEGHHGVVLVHHVVTMDRVLAQPVAEAEEQQHALVRMQLR